MNILGGVIYTYVRQFEKRQQNAKRLSKFVENGISSPEVKHNRNSKTTLISYEEDDDKHRTVWSKLIIKFPAHMSAESRSNIEKSWKTSKNIEKP